MDKGIPHGLVPRGCLLPQTFSLVLDSNIAYPSCCSSLCPNRLHLSTLCTAQMQACHELLTSDNPAAAPLHRGLQHAESLDAADLHVQSQLTCHQRCSTHCSGAEVFGNSIDMAAYLQKPSPRPCALHDLGKGPRKGGCFIVRHGPARLGRPLIYRHSHYIRGLENSRRPWPHSHIDIRLGQI